MLRHIHWRKAGIILLWLWWLKVEQVRSDLEYWIFMIHIIFNSEVSWKCQYSKLLQTNRASGAWWPSLSSCQSFNIFVLDFVFHYLFHMLTGKKHFQRLSTLLSRYQILIPHRLYWFALGSHPLFVPLLQRPWIKYLFLDPARHIDNMVIVLCQHSRFTNKLWNYDPEKKTGSYF